MAGLLALAACSGADSDTAPGASVATPSEGTPTEGTPGSEAVGTPWRFTADDLNLAGADGPILTDPTRLDARHQTEGSSPRTAAVIASDAVLVTAARPGPSAELDAVLVGIDADTGALAWTYEPTEGLLLNCAPELLGGDVVCLVGSRGDGPSMVALLDPTTGEITGGFPLPEPSDIVSIADGDVLVLLEVDTFDVYDIARYTAEGDLVWSVREAITDEVLPGDVFTFAMATSGGAVHVQMLNVLRVLALDDGTVLERGSGDLEEPDAVAVEISGGRVVTVDESGALVASLL